MELREAWRAIRASWWLLLVGLLLGGGLALGVSLAQTPQYQSSTMLFVSTLGSSSPTDALQGSQFSQERVKSYAELLTGDDLARRVIQRLNLQVAPGTLKNEISATAAADTVIIYVTVTDPSPQRAQTIAGAIGVEFPAMVAELETPRGGGASPVKVTVTQQPYLPTVPSSPKSVRNVGAGVLIGLLIGAGLAIVRARLDRSVKSPELAAELAEAPVIGTVLLDPALEKRHVMEKNSTSRTAEDYRQLRANLQFLNVDEPPKTIMVSSALPAEGKTTAVVNLASALADAGKRVTIVEADLRRPKITRYLGMVGGAGLTNVLAGTAEIDDVIQKYRDDLWVVPAGPLPPNPGELLASSQMSAVLDKLRAQNDYLLVDAAPLLPVADASALAVFTDGVVLSVRYGSTRHEELEQAAAILGRVGARTLGVILNMVPANAQGSAAYGYGRISYGGEYRAAE